MTHGKLQEKIFYMNILTFALHPFTCLAFLLFFLISMTKIIMKTRKFLHRDTLNTDIRYMHSHCRRYQYSHKNKHEHIIFQALVPVGTLNMYEDT